MKLRRRETGVETSLADGMLVGRLPECGLLIQEAGVSRKHAVIEKRGSDWWLKDLGSSNGVTCNGQKLPEFELRHGDLVTFGNIAYDVVDPAPAGDWGDELEIESPDDSQLSKPPSSVSMPPPKTPAEPEASAPSRSDLERARLRREAKGSNRARGLGDISQQPPWVLALLLVAGAGVLYGVGMGVRWLMNTINATG